jgi:tRNA (pseudouridine54-N1)-methyltransferase
MAPRSFVLVGQTALASPTFSTEDLPGSSGRLDVLLRAVRAGLLLSHGLRADASVYLVLRGGPLAPRVVRVRGLDAKFVRPDERSLAILLKKTLAVPTTAGELSPVRPGISSCAGDLEVVLRDLGDAALYLLHEQGDDIRGHELDERAAAFFIGDHLGFDEPTLTLLEQAGCRRLSVGPLSLHSDDVVTLVSNELDRRARPPSS